MNSFYAVNILNPYLGITMGCVLDGQGLIPSIGKIFPFSTTSRL
jgi:hypothetical protein